jgi:hypothetical protein
MLQPGHFRLQVPAPNSSEPVGLPAARAVLFFKTLDPLFFEQAAQRAVQSSGAQAHAALAHPLRVLEDRIAVAGLFGKAQKDEQDRFANLHMSSNDMSSTAILADSLLPVKRKMRWILKAIYFRRYAAY